mgnify:CR=1 FL=1
MSLEDELKRNTEALEKLTAAIMSAGSVPVKSAVIPAIEPAGTTPELKLPGKTYAEAAKLPPEEAAISAEIREQAVTWDQITAALVEHVKTKGRASAVAVMAAHGIQGKLTREQLGEDDYAKFYNAITA